MTEKTSVSRLSTPERITGTTSTKTAATTATPMATCRAAIRWRTQCSLKRANTRRIALGSLPLQPFGRVERRAEKRRVKPKREADAGAGGQAQQDFGPAEAQRAEKLFKTRPQGGRLAQEQHPQDRDDAPGEQEAHQAAGDAQKQRFRESKAEEEPPVGAQGHAHRHQAAPPDDPGGE